MTVATDHAACELAELRRFRSVSALKEQEAVDLEREACIRILEDMRPRNDQSDWTEYAHDIDSILRRAIEAINARYGA